MSYGPPTTEMLHRFLKENMVPIQSEFRRAVTLHNDRDAILADPKLSSQLRDFFFAGVGCLFMQADAVALEAPEAVVTDVEAKPAPGAAGSTIDDGPW